MPSIKSKLFYFTLALWTISIGLLYSPILLTFNRKIISKVGVTWSAGALKLLKLICNVQHKINHLERNLTTPCIVASKHESMWETIFLLHHFRPATFILKKELTYIPIYGWYLYFMGMIPISRQDGVRSIKSMSRLAHQRLAQGFNLIIFPEGTRTPNRIPLKAGTQYLHKHLQDYPLYPLAHNSGQYFAPKGEYNIKPGVIAVTIHTKFSFNENKKEYLQLLEQKVNHI